MRAFQPDVVFLELCSQRLPMLKPQDKESLQNMTLGSTLAALRRGESGVVEALLGWLQAQSARNLEVLPGEEFRVALTEGYDLGAEVLLGDRPMQVRGEGMMNEEWRGRGDCVVSASIFTSMFASLLLCFFA